MVTRGIFIGRFQPIHLGHIKAINQIYEEVGELIICDGSAQVSHSFNNPFTAGERITFVKSALDENNLDASRYYLIPVQDINDNRLWVAHLTSLTPKFDIVYSNNSLVKRLLFESGFKVKEFPLYQRDKYSATQIRLAIIQGKPWEKFVPSSVAKFIKTIGGVERLKIIGETVLKI